MRQGTRQRGQALRMAVRARRLGRRPVVAAGWAWHGLVDWFNGLALSENAVLIGFAVAIGALGALGVVLFYALIDLAFAAFYRWPVEHLPLPGFAPYRPLLTAAGFAAAWWLVRRFGAGVEGPTVPDVQLAVARRGGDVPARPALARTAASAVTLGSGGSAGSEGPVAVLGSAIGSFLGRAFRFEASRVKILVGAGAAAGISAAFNAPLTGAFFALEEVLGSFAVGAFPPVVVSSVVAAIVSHAFFGNNPAFPIPVAYGYELKREVFLFFPLLGLLAGLAAVLFIRTYFWMETAVRRQRVPPALVPWLGGAAVGLVVLLSRGTLVGHGHLAFRLEVFGRMAWSTLALLAVGKIVATSLTLHTGGSGGVFTPSLFLGAATGGAFGVILTQLFPDLGLHPESYALVGMGAVVAAATNAPITGILIVFEMTNDYAIMLPLMLATVIAYTIARRLEPDSLYSGSLRRRGERIEHGADRDVLARLRVADGYDPDPQVVGEGATLAQLLEHLGRGEQTEFPVVDDSLRLTGIITITDLARLAADHRELASLLVAADLAAPAETIALGDTLLEAIHRMGIRGAASLPVVDPATGRLVGMISRAHIFALYERAIAGEPVGGVPFAPPGPAT